MSIFQEERHIKDVRRQWIEWVDDEGGGYPVYRDEQWRVVLTGSGEYKPGEPVKLMNGTFNCILAVRYAIDDFWWGSRLGFNAASAAQAKQLCEEAFDKEVCSFEKLESLQDDNRSEAEVWQHYHEDIEGDHMFGAEFYKDYGNDNPDQTNTAPSQ